MHFLGWRLVAALCVLVGMQSHPVAGAEVTTERVLASLPEFEKLAERTWRTSGVPGMAIIIVHKDRVAYLKGFGVREVGKEAVIDADTVFQLASVSKPMTATVMAALVSDGTVGWDDRVIDHDPGFRLYEPWVTNAVTIRDFLCHRSGLPDHGGDLLEDLGYDRAEVLRRLRYLKPGSSFRSHYDYTNFGYSEAAFAAARAAGKPWEDVATAKLFKPLGMKSSSYRYADFTAIENRARLHVRAEGKWVARYVREPDAQSPAGGASSSAREVALWLRLLLGNGTFEGEQIIRAEALGETFRPQIVNHAPKDPATDRAAFYGLGWNVSYRAEGLVALGHSGGFDLGAATVVNLLPGENLGIAVLTNGMPIGVPETVGASFLDLVLRGKPERDWLSVYGPAFATMMKAPYGSTVDYAKPLAKTSPSLPLGAYVGTYQNDLYGELAVVLKDKALSLRLGPKQREYALRHWNRDVFIYQPVGENAGGLSAVTFWVGPDQKATRVVLENLDVEGQGTFIKPPAKQ